MPKNYKVISSSCYGGNKVFYAGNIFQAHDVSEQDLEHLLKGGYIEETDEDANASVEIPVTVVEAPAEDKSLLEPIAPVEPEAPVEPIAPAEPAPLEAPVEPAPSEVPVDPAALLSDNKNKNKNK